MKVALHSMKGLYFLFAYLLTPSDIIDRERLTKDKIAKIKFHII